MPDFASKQANGLMSSSDKKKLDELDIQYPGGAGMVFGFPVTRIVPITIPAITATTRVVVSSAAQSLRYKSRVVCVFLQEGADADAVYQTLYNDTHNYTVPALTTGSTDGTPAHRYIPSLMNDALAAQLLVFTVDYRAAGRGRAVESSFERNGANEAFPITGQTDLTYGGLDANCLVGTYSNAGVFGLNKQIVLESGWITLDLVTDQVTVHMAFYNRDATTSASKVIAMVILD